jgi:glycosyltransferase involved in cell wall biosynthesis
MKSFVTILICDINIQKSGHYIGYNQYLLDNYHELEKENPLLHFSFLYNRKAQELLSFNEHTLNRVNFLDEPVAPQTGFYKRHAILQKIKSFSNSRKIDHMIFMEFDRYQLSFLMTKFKCGISGILFRPHHRLVTSNNGIRKTFVSKLTRIKKRLADKMLARNPMIQNIYILNDIDGTELLNKLHRSAKFKYLPDPIYTYKPVTSLSTLNGFSHTSYKYLIFGALDERKNIANILKAYSRAKLNFDSELLLIGSAETSYLEHLKDLISKLNSIDNEHKKVFIRAEFVTDEEMDYYFSISDVSLLIYKDFFGSSGLLGRVVLHKKKVIGSNAGVIGDLINKYELGISCDPYDILDMAKAFSSISKYKVNAAACDNFYKQHSPDAFLSTLLAVQTV